jgi:hypothetical protein
MSDRKPDVFLAIPNGRGVLPTETALAIAAWVAQVPYSIQFGKVEISLIHEARNLLVKEFLASGAEYMLWLDDDMIVTADQFVKIVEVAQRRGAVSGVYCFRNEDRGVVGQVHGPIEEDGCAPCVYAGLGFACISRYTIQALADNAVEYRFLKHVAKRVFDASKNPAEDVQFFLDMHKLDMQPWLDTTLVVGHKGYYTYYPHPQGTIDLLENFNGKG